MRPSLDLSPTPLGRAYRPEMPRTHSQMTTFHPSGESFSEVSLGRFTRQFNHDLDLQGRKAEHGIVETQATEPVQGLLYDQSIFEDNYPFDDSFHAPNNKNATTISQAKEKSSITKNEVQQGVLKKDARAATPTSLVNKPDSPLMLKRSMSPYVIDPNGGPEDFTENIVYYLRDLDFNSDEVKAKYPPAADPYITHVTRPTPAPKESNSAASTATNPALLTSTSVHQSLSKQADTNSASYNQKSAQAGSYEESYSKSNLSKKGPSGPLDASLNGTKGVSTIFAKAGTGSPFLRESLRDFGPTEHNAVTEAFSQPLNKASFSDDKLRAGSISNVSNNSCPDLTSRSSSSTDALERNFDGTGHNHKASLADAESAQNSPQAHQTYRHPSVEDYDSDNSIAAPPVAVPDESHFKKNLKSFRTGQLRAQDTSSHIRPSTRKESPVQSLGRKPAKAAARPNSSQEYHINLQPTRIPSLEQKEMAERVSALHDEIKRLQITLRDEKHRYSLLDLTFKEECENSAALKEDLEDERKKTLIAEQKLEAEHETLSQREQELRTEQEKIAIVQQKLEEEQVKFVTIEHELKIEQEKRAIVEQKLEAEHGKSATFEQKLKTEQNKVTMVQQNLEEEQAKSAVIERELRTEQQQVAIMKQELEAEQAESDTFEHKLRTEQKKLTMVEQKLEAEKARSATIEHELETQQKKLAMVEEKLEAEQAKSANTKHGLMTEQEQLTSIEQKLKAEKAKSAIMEHQLRIARKEVSAFGKKASALEVQLEERRQKLATFKHKFEESALAAEREAGELRGRLAASQRSEAALKKCLLYYWGTAEVGVVEKTYPDGKSKRGVGYKYKY